MSILDSKIEDSKAYFKGGAVAVYDTEDLLI